ncbi:MAG: MFS transporter, partial [Enterococcus faecalis]
IDFSGFACIAIAIMTFFGGIFLGQESGFGSLQSYLLFIIAIIALGLFIMVERKRKSPLIKFAIFKNKIFTLSLLSAVLIFASNFFVNVVIPFYLQDARKLSASYAGLLMMVFPLLMVVGAPLSGYLTDKIGPGILTFGGLLLLCCTSLMYMFLDMNSPIWYYVIATAIMGLGNALFQSPNNTMVMSSVEKQDLGVAGSMNSFARNLGMVIGIALSTTILYRGMSEAYGERVTTYLANRPDIFIVGMRETFFVAFLLCVAAFILTILRFRKTTK